MFEVFHFPVSAQSTYKEKEYLTVFALAILDVADLVSDPVVEDCSLFRLSVHLDPWS